MRKQSFYNYDNPEFAGLKAPMREVMSAYGAAEKWFAAIKDVVLIDFAMPNLSDAIHRMEHKQPEYVDEFAVCLHEHGLLLEYPPTDELVEQFNNDIDKVFEICVAIIDETDAALFRFIHATQGGRFNAISLKTEELQIRNSDDREKLLYAWAMWDNGDMSRASFDSWCKHIFETEDE